MEQLLLKMDDKSDVKVIAASAYNFRIELVKKVGKDDIPGLIDISHCMADRFGSQALLTKTNIPKYFNSNTLPFLARFKGEIIGYIIGVPLEYFKQESWAHFDVNLGKKNTLYTYAFVVKNKFVVERYIVNYNLLRHWVYNFDRFCIIYSLDCFPFLCFWRNFCF